MICDFVTVTLRSNLAQITALLDYRLVFQDWSQFTITVTTDGVTNLISIVLVLYRPALSL